MTRLYNSVRLCIIIVLCIWFVYSIYQHSQIYNENRAAQLYSSQSSATTPTVRIEDAIDGQQLRVANEMKDIEYSKQMVASAANGQPMRSVILSTYRSGSTFFGDILNTVPGNYYHYEPLKYFNSDDQIRGSPKSIEAIDTLRQLLKCNYTGLDDCLNYVSMHDDVFKYNERLWRFCKMYPQFCFDPNVLNPLCHLFPFQSMKLVRLRAELSEELLLDTSLNIKIVLLIRDPRGTMLSRQHEKWCMESECGNATMMCEDMVSDFKAAKMLYKKYAHRFKAIRYEELEPFEMTKEIFKFYGLPFHAKIKKFLNTHTKRDIGNTFSTFRDSKKTPLKWMRDLNLDEIKRIQLECTEAMLLWGYKEMGNKGSFLTKFDPLLQFPFATTHRLESNRKYF